MNWLSAPLRYAREGGPVRREAMIALAALLAGLLLMPVAVWLAGRAALGEYTHGGAFALIGDYLRGLVRGEFAYWVVLCGPYAFVLLARILRRVLR